ncbi:4-hydroxythreonine-4-phosphate dehydrogenase [Blautia hydrogenotrophica CAG:147]|uniref:4-hydroxythreonine-4-phosphate dehydrogenase PdxA n=1 Tax=Blautia hydrogenotrophica TaxID=53443 RepID=UPI00033E2943|nr:4-hydroxythreonine-4-phosphate dehydrogenase PdxA [Blautia hydrogenotrophica]CCX59859.1 4-hydroxythreonine-4-phosphate dehydrogenase [Blautia hydrogenotrophica CAG:147]CUM95832.1 4-hydroxythreonine-4-phosphate dehydrogenase 2 [Blautia hydrogenotrophica]SCH92924.1 4-hydroxythreonine-4-phosphate dehydrogenase 2 [uncultured Blautia sp.]
MNKRPIVGITMGDPAGNGAEITVKALANPVVYENSRPIVIGDANCMEQAVKIVGQEGKIRIHAVKEVKDACFEYGVIDVYDMGLVDMEKHIFGKVSKMCGEAAFQYVVKVIDLAMKGEIDATVTNALNKEAINMAGHHYSGHTEIYADYTNTSKYTMMLAHDNLRVVHVSTHVSLRQACDLVKKDRVLEVIRIADNACRALGIENPKVGVAGLNPHCGENGMFGTEEIEEIQPAIDAAMAEGICIPEKKPTPPDTVFSKALGGWYDIVVAMYHDQGHIPLKVKGFVYNRELKKWDAVAGVNVTLGIPIIRVSVDHGTGFGHAGTGSADELSLANSIEYAIRLANNKK